MKKREICSKKWMSICVYALLFLMCGLFLWFRCFSTQSLFPLLEGEGKPVYNVWIYQNPGVSGFDSEAKISDRQVEDLLALTPVKRGSSFDAIPCPTFQIHVTFEDKFYELAVGKNGKICVHRFSFKEPDESTTFWADSGALFSALYERHISAGGDPIP